MDLNDLFSPSLKVKPLAEGEVVKFRLLNAHKKEKNRDEPSCPELWALPKEASVYDHGTGVTVTMPSFRTVTVRHNPGTKEKYEEPKLEPIIFVKGEVTIKHDEMPWYIFLTRYNGNVSNPFRKKGSRKVYEVVREDKAVAKSMQDEDLRYGAEKIVRECNVTDLRAICEKLNKSADARIHVKTRSDEFEKMKLILIGITKWNPKAIILASGDAEAKAKIMISDARMFNILDLIEGPAGRAWWINPLDNKNMKQVLEVSPDKDSVDELLTFFKTAEGGQVFVQLSSQLKKIFKTTA